MQCKDTNLFVGGGVDPFWDVTDEGGLADLTKPCDYWGTGKPPGDWADGEPVGTEPTVVEFKFLLSDGCSPDVHVGEATEAEVPGENHSPGD